jgi:hypothetical protein
MLFLIVFDRFGMFEACSNSINDAKTTCTACSAGFEVDSATHRCKPCEDGTFSGEGDASCRPCSKGIVTEEGTVCTICPSLSLPSAASDVCLCQKETFLVGAFHPKHKTPIFTQSTLPANPNSRNQLFATRPHPLEVEARFFDLLVSPPSETQRLNAQGDQSLVFGSLAGQGAACLVCEEWRSCIEEGTTRNNSVPKPGFAKGRSFSHIFSVCRRHCARTFGRLWRAMHVYMLGCLLLINSSTAMSSNLFVHPSPLLQQPTTKTCTSSSASTLLPAKPAVFALRATRETCAACARHGITAPRP